ncbi:MAG: hypothetical protein ACRD3A_05895 [Terriglobales bacterium]
MWDMTSAWFDVAIVLGIFAVGGILFGRFEEHKPRWRRLLKVVVVTTVFIALIQTAGRVWAYGVLALPLLAAAYVHLVWLPKHGIDGWTGEPRDKYLELVGARARSETAG